MIKYLVETYSWIDFHSVLYDDKASAIDYCKNAKSHLPSYRFCRVYEVKFDKDIQDADEVLEYIDNGFVENNTIAVSTKKEGYKEL